jgi:hypothetical protein
MTPTAKYAYERLWGLNDHADLHEYGPDLLISDVQTVVGALASAEREIAQLRAQLQGIEDRTVAHVRDDLWGEPMPC